MFNYIDWDSWAKFFAVIDISQAYHGAIAKSVRIYYNPVTAQIEPILLMDTMELQTFQTL